MKPFIIGLLLGIMLVLPGSAESAEVEEGIYKIVTILNVVQEILNKNDWKTCGGYFATVKSAGEKTVHFNFEKRTSDEVTRVFVFVTDNRMAVSINKKLATPLVVVLQDAEGLWFDLSMNMEDYLAGLPCFGNGVDM